MAEHPILFSGPMVRAILEGRKTQTRRVLKRDTDAPVEEPYVLGHEGDGAWFSCATDGTTSIVFCPYGKPGDRLWCRETFAHLDDLKTKDPGVYALQSRAFFRADHPTGLSHDDGNDLTWRPSIFMPRELSRINLEIVNVRVERLQEISEADATAKGMEWDGLGETLHPVNRFLVGWDSINGKRKGCTWADNPWVWCISFRRID